MTMLVTGATGTIGRHVIDQLVQRGASVRALVRDPARADFPAGVDVVKGDLMDPDSLRGACHRTAQGDAVAPRGRA